MIRNLVGQGLFNMTQKIYFYRVNEPYGVFSNFHSTGFSVSEIWWPTVEHYFQAQKFHDEILREKIRSLTSPMEAAKVGRSRNYPLREDWELIKDDVMRFAVLKKFSQNDEAKNILLSTGGAELIEHTKNDRYWADGGDGTGKNMLGKILMETRSVLHK
ncbi:NADAR family protein [Cronobacter sakazakii]|nr:NADAR family protein [Cronobacter sakazakii]EJV9473049.1 NADAR family protein [Cronobacter sakazakii]EKK4002434.1 NADAR family protein [Cronobacter sakazakii]EKK5199861.1 NADAR family protein [Cronobacter sakazakii]EKK7679280.1 NADAR family protein [Cronobacter sakazakii]